jgi:hypothetical protein
MAKVADRLTQHATRIGSFLRVSCPCGFAHFYRWHDPAIVLNTAARFPMCEPGSPLHRPPGWIYLHYD